MQRRTLLNGLAGMGAVYSMNATAMVQFFPMPSKEKWAIIFGTWYGTARDAAMWISEGMGGIAPVFDARQKPDLKAYDHLIIGTAIQGGRGPKQFEEFIQANISEVKNKVRAYYTVSGNGGDRPGPQTQAMYIDNYLAKLCQATVPFNRAFSGRITKALLSQEDAKTLEKLFKKQYMPLEDYDHLARWDCLQFGRQILLGRSAQAKKA